MPNDRGPFPPPPLPPTPPHSRYRFSAGPAAGEGGLPVILSVQPPPPGARRVFFRRAEGGGRGGAGPRSLRAARGRRAPALREGNGAQGRAVGGVGGGKSLRGRALPLPPPSPPAAVFPQPIARRRSLPASLLSANGNLLQCCGWGRGWRRWRGGGCRAAGRAAAAVAAALTGAERAGLGWARS